MQRKKRAAVESVYGFLQATAGKIRAIERPFFEYYGGFARTILTQRGLSFTD